MIRTLYNAGVISAISEDLPEVHRLLLTIKDSDTDKLEMLTAQSELNGALKVIESYYNKVQKITLNPKKVEKLHIDLSNLFVVYESALKKVENRANAGEDIMVPDAFNSTSDIFERIKDHSESLYNHVVNNENLTKSKVHYHLTRAIPVILIAAALGSTTFIAMDAIKDKNAAIVESASRLDEINRLQAKIEELESEKKGLSDRIAVLEEKLDNATITEDELRELYSLRIEVKNLESEISDLNKEKDDLTNKNEALEEENRELKNKIAALEKDLADSNALVDSLREQLAKDPTNAELKEQLAEALAKNERLKAQVESLEIENGELKEELATLNNNYNLLKSKNEQLDSENKALIATNTELGNIIAGLEQEVADYEVKIDGLIIEFNDLKEEFNSAKAEIERLEAIIASGSLSDAERKDYEEKIAYWKREAEEYRKQLEDKTEQYDSLLVDYGKVTEQKDGLLAECAYLKEQLQDYDGLVSFIDRYYYEIMGHNGLNLTSSDKLIGIISHFINNETSSEDRIKLGLLYDFLDSIENNGSDYAGMTPEQLEAVLDVLAGGMLADSSDEPTHGAVNEGDGSQPGNNGNGNGSGTGSKEENGDTAERLPGDN